MSNAPLTGNQMDASGEARLFGAMRHYWQPASYAADLGDQPQGVTVLGERLVLVRLGGQVRAFPDLCVHRGTALSLASVEGDQLRCAYHGWTYGPDGVCTSIPARFGASIPTKARLRRYPAAEQGGLIWVCLEAEPRHPVPEFPEVNDPAYQIVTMPVYEWDCNFARRIENFVDFAHFAWVHDGILGDHNHPEVPDHEVWREGSELRMRIGMTEPEDNPLLDTVGGPSREMYIPKNYRIYIPNAIWLRRQMSPGNYFVLFMSTCPISPKHTRSFTFCARNYDLDVDDQKFVDFQELIIGQDQPITESQRPEELPVDLSAELHVRGVDRVSVEYRKWLIEIANAQAAGDGRRAGEEARGND
jgi:vanillate O-demethylase monooxygenase subunit